MCPSTNQKYLDSATFPVESGPVGNLVPDSSVSVGSKSLSRFGAIVSESKRVAPARRLSTPMVIPQLLTRSAHD
jgi:hypothetical protein